MRIFATRKGGGDGAGCGKPQGFHHPYIEDIPTGLGGDGIELGLALVPIQTAATHLARLVDAQAAIRQGNTSNTSLYAHLADDELDNAYWETFEKI